METVIFVEVLDRADHVRERHRISSFPLRLGRGYGNAVILDDAHVAPSHAVVVLCEDGQLEYRDLNSINGTLIDGKPVRQCRLLADQTLTLGATRIRLRTPACAVPPAVALPRADYHLHNWRPSWGVAISAALVFAAFASMVAFAHEFDDPRFSRAIAVGGLGALSGVFAWAVLFAATGRVIVRRSSFRVQMLITMVGMMASDLLGLLLNPLRDAVSTIPAAEATLAVLVALPAFLGVVLQLQVATDLRRRVAISRLLAVVGGVILLVELKNYAESREYRSEPDLAVDVQVLPDKWLPSTTTAAFFDDAKSLKRDVDNAP